LGGEGLYVGNFGGFGGKASEMGGGGVNLKRRLALRGRISNASWGWKNKMLKGKEGFLKKVCVGLIAEVKNGRLDG